MKKEYKNNVINLLKYADEVKGILKYGDEFFKGCFIVGTLVTTDKGLKVIEEIKNR